MGFKRKFEIKDKVVVKSTKEVGKVINYLDREYLVEFEHDVRCWYRAEKLEKYTEEALFNVGDRVKYVSKDPYDGNYKIIGKVGTVVDVEELDFDYKRVGVEFDEDVNGHSCDGKGKKNHCWNVPISRVEKVKTEDVMLETDDSKEEDWRVGDEVVVVKNFNKAKLGMKGTVIVVENNKPLVEFEQPMGGHDGDARGRYGHCWWMNSLNRGLVKRIKKEKPVIFPELETGMKVKLHDGRIGFVIADANTLNYGKQKFVILLEGSFIIGDKYDSEGKHASGQSRDIDEVYAYMDGKGNVIVNGGSMDLKETMTMKKVWERSYEKKITKVQAEKELSEKHGVKVVIEG